MSAAPKNPTAPLALVVEDDPDAAEVAAGMLGLLGYNTRVAGDGHTALQMLSQTKPDLVLLDVCLPGMDGMALMQVAERFADLGGVPIVAASAVYSPEGTEARVLKQLGVQWVMAKPFSLAGLRSVVHQIDPARDLPSVPRPEDDAKLPEAIRPRRRTRSSISAESHDLVGRAAWEDEEATCFVERLLGDDVLLRTTGGVPEEGMSITVEVADREQVDGVQVVSALRIRGEVFRVKGAPPGSRVRVLVHDAQPAESWQRFCQKLRGGDAN